MKSLTVIFSCAVSLYASTASGSILIEAYYRLGESASLGANARPLDISGHQRHFGGAVGEPATVISPSHGGVDSTAALHFPGGLTFSGYYGCTEGEFSLTNNFGIELWVRPTTLGDTNGLFLDKRIFCGNGNAQGSFTFVLGNERFGGLLEDWAWVGGNIATGGGVPATTGEWTHLAMVLDNGKTTFYANGIAVGSYDGLIPSIPLKGSGFHLGVNPLAIERFSGDIDELRIFSFAPGAFSISDLNITITYLKIAKAGNNISLSWTNGPNFIVQSNSSINKSSGWVDIPGASNSPVILGAVSNSLFFKLKRQ